VSGTVVVVVVVVVVRGGVGTVTVRRMNIGSGRLFIDSLEGRQQGTVRIEVIAMAATAKPVDFN